MDIRRRTQIGGIKKTSSGGDDIIPEPTINTDNYLTIEARENGLTASLSTNACEYCVDGDGNWKKLAAGTNTESIDSGHTLSFRGNLTPTTANGIGTFAISKKCNLKGNCMSMLFGDEAVDNYSLSGKSYAFYQLFYNCTNIVNVSSNFLPATTLASNCYYDMFYGCTSMVNTPDLPAEVACSQCYYSMFYNCGGILEPSSVFNLNNYGSTHYCCCKMFANCTSLQKTPYFLECTSVYEANNMFEYMFDGCVNLESVCGELPPIGDVSYGGRGMFRNCKNLVSAPIIQEGLIMRTYSFSEMFSGCEKLKSVMDISSYSIGSRCDYSMYCMYKGCLSLTSISNFFPNSSSSENPFSQYNCANMFEDCVNLKNANLRVGGNYAYSGNIGKNAFSHTFKGCKSLVSVNLPQSLLYKNVKLGESCFEGMFYGCTSLTTAPELPLTTLANACYRSMFQGCSSLTTAPALPATTLKDYCYNGMFLECTSLTTAPELPATTLVSNCYGLMFVYCNKLNYIKMLATNISASDCLYNWVSGVASSGTFVRHADMTSLPTGASGIPSGWTVVNDGEESGLTFPVTLYGTKLGTANDDLGIRVYNFIKNTKSSGDYLTESEVIAINATDGSRSETLYVQMVNFNENENQILLATNNDYWRCILWDDGVLNTDYD